MISILSLMLKLLYPFRLADMMICKKSLTLVKGGEKIGGIRVQGLREKLFQLLMNLTIFFE